MKKTLLTLAATLSVCASVLLLNSCTYIMHYKLDTESKYADLIPDTEINNETVNTDSVESTEPAEDETAVEEIQPVYADISITNAARYTKPVTDYFDFGYQYDDHHVILPQINGNTDAINSFNEKIYDSYSHYIDTLENDEEENVLFYIDYYSETYNGIAGIIISEVVGYQASEVYTRYTAYYFDANTDRELTYREYLDALGVDPAKLADALSFEMNKNIYEYDEPFNFSTNPDETNGITMCIFGKNSTIFCHNYYSEMSGDTETLSSCKAIISNVFK